MSGISDANRKLDTSNGLQVMSLGVTLAQSNQLNNLARLQAEANEATRETNHRLNAIENGIDISNQWLSNIASQATRTTESLNRLNDQVSTTNQLLIEQTRGIQSVKSSIDQLRFEAAWQNFSNWIQTENGKTYQKWTKQATKLVDRMGEYTKRMSKAREQDLKYVTTRLSDTLPPVPVVNTVYEPEPVRPNVPVVHRPPEPGKPRHKVLSKLVQWLMPVLGLVFGTLFGMTHTVVYAEDLYEWNRNIPMHDWSMILGAGMGLAAGIILGILFADSIINGVLGQHIKETPSLEWQQQNQAYQQTVQLIKQQQAEYRKHHDQWEKTRNRTELQLQQMTNARRKAVKQLPQKAGALLPDPTCWTVKDPNQIAQEISQLMEHSFVFPPADMSILTDTHIPVFAMPDSLPKEAKHMKAELAQILEENRHNPDAKVAYGKPLNEMSAADRLRKFQRE